MHCHSTLGIHEVLEGKYLMSAETPDVCIRIHTFGPLSRERTDHSAVLGV